MTLHTKTKKGVHGKFTALVIAALLALATTLFIVAPKLAGTTKANASADLSGVNVVISFKQSNNITCLKVEAPLEVKDIFPLGQPTPLSELIIYYKINGHSGIKQDKVFKVGEFTKYNDGCIPFSDIADFEKYGDYEIYVDAYYGLASKESNPLFFTHSPLVSDDSNILDICIGQYTQPTLTASSSSITVNRGASYGDNYTLNIGNSATNEVVATATKSWSDNSVMLDTEFLAPLTRGKAYDIWAVADGKNLYKTSGKSATEQLTIYDDIALSLDGSIISFAAVNGVTSYKLTLVCDGATMTKTIDGTSIDFSEFNISDGLCYISAEVNSAGLKISDSNGIVIKVTQLAAPVIRVDGENLVWDKVEGANGYRVFYNDTFIDVTEPTVNLMGLGLDLGNYNLKVRSIGNLAKSGALTMASVSTYLTQMIAVNYNVDGDLSQSLVAYGSGLTLPLVTKEGKTFEGWYYDKEFTKLASGGDKVISNVVLYAKLSDTPIAELSFWASVWKTAKPIIIWGGIALGVALVIVIIILIVKKIRG